MQKKEIRKVVQPKELFKFLGVKETEEAERVFNSALSFLVYMAVDDVLETTSAKFTKIAPDMIHIDSAANLRDMVDSLEKRRVIKFSF